MPTAVGREALVEDIRGLLERADMEGLMALYGQGRRVLRLLISLTYDKAGVLSWRAMDAIGRITAGLDEDSVRNTIQRLLWMMREESGTNAWSSGEIISEIIRNNPDPYEDVVPIVVTFHEEPILRPGALWCMYRVGAVRRDLVAPFAPVAAGYMSSADPQERGFALLALGAAGDASHRLLVTPLLEDRETFRYYDGRDLVERGIGEVARDVAARLEDR